MKKLIASIAIAVSAFALFGEGYQEVYDTKASIKVPYLSNGVRNYSTQTLQGKLYVVFASENSEFESAQMVLTNKKTKAVHTIDFTDGFLNMMGKSSGKGDKYIPRTTATVYLEGADTECEGNETHELIKSVCFAGNGSLKNIKSTTVGCGVCGESTKVTTYCQKLNKISGSVVGYMDCECPDDEDGWWHTLVKTVCGFLEDEDDNYVRSHNAAFWGSWSATYNTKQSGEID